MHSFISPKTTHLGGPGRFACVIVGDYYYLGCSAVADKVLLAAVAPFWVLER